MQFRLSFISNYAVLIDLVLGIVSCGQAGKRHPAAGLQGMLASRLEDPAICPGGDLRDIQQLIASAEEACLEKLYPDFSCSATSSPRCCMARSAS